MKGQSALEFLTTYGWALMAVLIIVGAIAYFNIGNIGTIQKEECSFGAQLICLETEITETEVKLRIQNGYGKRIQIQNTQLPEIGISCSPDATIESTGIEEITCPVSLEARSYANLAIKAEVKREGVSSPWHEVSGYTRAKVKS